MAATPYVLPRETRESGVDVGNGTVGPYGPSAYKVFDTVDVKVFAKALGETVFSDVTSGCTIAKVNPANAYDFFTVTFGASVPATTAWYHQARRVAERSIAVTKGGTLDSNQLEKELSKQATVESELRRDLDNGLQLPPGTGGLNYEIGAIGNVVAYGLDGGLKDSGISVAGLTALVDGLPRSVPHVFLGVGQSNGAKTPALASNWPENLKIWNWTQAMGTTPGTAFIDPDPTKMNIFWKEAAEYAIDNPLEPVYLINVSKDALAIDNWLPAPPVFDMYAITVSNVVAALSKAGVDHIDALLWWEGESSIADGSYVTKFNSVQTRFAGNSWYRPGTPILIHGIIPKSIDAATASFNSTLMQCAQADIINRFYIFPDPAVIPAARWADDPHMDGAGYQMYGRMAYRAWQEGRSKLYDRQSMIEPETLAIGIGQIPSTDRVGITYTNNAAAILRMANFHAGASASAQLAAQSNAGILGLIANSIAGGATGTLLWTGAGNLNIDAIAGIRLRPAGASDAGGVDSSGNWDIATGKTFTLGGAPSSGLHAATKTYVDAAFAAAGGVVGPAAAVSARLATFNGTTGKIIQDGGAAISTDGTLASNSDTKVPTEKAVKAYADALIAAQDAMVFKGVIDCSANPNYPAADRGATYRVSVAGKIGGGSGVNVEAGDILLCLTDSTASGSQATVGAQWSVIQTNIDGAVVGPALAVDLRLAAFSGTSGKLLADSGVAVSTDGTLASNSDAKVPTEKAVKAYAQPIDADLTALAANSTAGFWAYTGAGTGAARSLSAGIGITIANPAGTAGDPAVSVKAGTVKQMINLACLNAVLNAANTTYMASGNAGTENFVYGTVTEPGTFQNLYIKQNVAPGGAQTTIYTLMKNGVATAITCTVTGAAVSASDTSHTVTFAAGDTWSIRCVNSATAATTVPTGGITFVPNVV